MSDFTGHTPGPWEFDEGNMGACFGRPYYGIITNTDYSVFINVGATADDYRGNHGREDECVANARLIAAAPELLAERDRLRGRCGELRGSLVRTEDRLGELARENVRLREALESIRDMPEYDSDDQYRLRQIARAILQEDRDE